METTARCPYCVLNHEFRPMIAHVDGRFICNKCGHTTNPSDTNYECHCPKCVDLTRSRAPIAS
jgi:late competence protein required for DNA uptake (superfamily II DNA/RNA helicase)